jgi:sugar phosphate permease
MTAPVAISYRHSRIVQRTPVYYGWVIWALATIGMIGAAPAMGFTISLFNDHFIAEFGISRTMLSTLFGVGTFAGALCLTWLGKRIDRHGSRKVGVRVVAVYVAVLLAMSTLLTGPLTLLIAFFLLRASGQGGMMLVSGTVIAKWWERRRGWVTGLSLVAVALSDSVYLPAVQRLIDAHGWRTTWLILGVVVGVTVLPLWWLLMRDRPEDYGLRPDGGPVPAEPDLPDAPHEVNWTLSEAQHTAMFWVFVMGRVLTVVFMSGLIFHQVSIFVAVGHDAIAAAETFGLMALFRAGITLVAGRTISRIRPGAVIALQITAVLIALVLATMMTEHWMLVAFAAALGVVVALGQMFDGTVWADLYGRVHHGAIRGFVTTGLVIGTSVGPIIYGVGYDMTGEYKIVLLAGVAVLIVPLVLSLVVRPPKVVEAIELLPAAMPAVGD